MTNSFDETLKSARESKGKNVKEVEFKESFKKDRKMAMFEIAKYLKKRYHVKSIGEERSEVFVYKRGIYIAGKKILKVRIQKILEELVTEAQIQEIISKIINMSHIDRDKFDDTDKDLINVKNGIVNLRTGKLTKHSHKYYFTNQIPVKYDIRAMCPKFSKFLTEILTGEAEIRVIEEFFGYCLYRSHFIKKALILVGERDTGKSTLINVLKVLIGEKNVVGIALQNLGDRFSMAAIYRKWVNIYDDLPSNAVKYTGMFKMLTGNSPIDAEKKFGDHFGFNSFCKLVYSCNKVPQPLSRDIDDSAYFSRWLMVNFTKKIKSENMDKDLLAKLTTESELSGILNLAILGLGRLFQNQDFTYKVEPEEIKKQMLRSDPLAAFCYDCLERDADGWISKNEMHKAYSEYAEKRGLSGITIDRLGKMLPTYATYIDSRLKADTQTGRQMRSWLFVRINRDKI